MNAALSTRPLGDAMKRPKPTLSVSWQTVVVEILQRFNPFVVIAAGAAAHYFLIEQAAGTGRSVKKALRCPEGWGGLDNGIMCRMETSRVGRACRLQTAAVGGDGAVSNRCRSCDTEVRSPHGGRSCSVGAC